MLFIESFILGAALALLSVASYFYVFERGCTRLLANLVVALEIVVVTCAPALLGQEDMQLAECVGMICGFAPCCFWYFFHKGKQVASNML